MVWGLGDSLKEAFFPRPFYCADFLIVNDEISKLCIFSDNLVPNMEIYVIWITAQILPEKTLSQLFVIFF